MKVVLILLSFLVSTSAFAADDFYATLKLAIEHFNGNGEKDLQAHSPEHRYMMDALKAVRTQIPELKDVNKMSFDLKEFSALQLKVEVVQGDLKATDKIEFFKQKVADLVDGCGYTKETVISEQNLGFTPASQGTKTTTTYRLDGNGTMKCSNPFIASLIDAGINVVVSNEDISRRGNITYKLSFEQGSNLYRDMRYVKNQILQLKGVDSAFFNNLNTVPSLDLIGNSSDITLVGSNGQGQLDEPVVFEFYQGEGDCPSGCISNIYTQVKVTPGPKGFNAKVISKTGN
jgi:hypothetical protein